MDQQILDVFLTAFVTLFVIVDPVGMAPVFAGLTKDAPKAHRRRMAINGSLVATAVLLFFAFVGKPFLSSLGISLDALRVAGGILLFIIGFEMVMEKRQERKSDTAEEIHDYFHDDISVFPIAIPLTAGPGAMASIILLMSDQTGDLAGQVAVLSGLGLTMAITMTTFLAAGPLMNLLGPTVNTVITRVLGVIVAALATQFVLDGLKGTFFGG